MLLKSQLKESRIRYTKVLNQVYGIRVGMRSGAAAPTDEEGSAGSQCLLSLGHLGRVVPVFDPS